MEVRFGRLLWLHFDQPERVTVDLRLVEQDEEVMDGWIGDPTDMHRVQHAILLEQEAVVQVFELDELFGALWCPLIYLFGAFIGRGACTEVGTCCSRVTFLRSGDCECLRSSLLIVVRFGVLLDFDLYGVPINQRLNDRLAVMVIGIFVGRQQPFDSVMLTPIDEAEVGRGRLPALTQSFLRRRVSHIGDNFCILRLSSFYVGLFRACLGRPFEQLVGQAHIVVKTAVGLLRVFVFLPSSKAIVFHGGVVHSRGFMHRVH